MVGHPGMRRRSLAAYVLLLAGMLAGLFGCQSGSGGRVVVGSKNFTEQIVLAEVIAQQIEARTNLKVEKRLNLGGTLLAQQALVSGEIDLYPEYTGTALTGVLGEQPSGDAAEVYRRVKEGYASRFGLEVGPPLGFSNTFAMVVRGEDAARWKLRTISDVGARAPEWRLGCGYEFKERPDGYDGWAKLYGLRFREAPRVMDLGLLYRALEQKQVDIVAGNSTDGVIAAMKLVVLEDDRHYFPPYQAVPIVRSEALERYPELRAALDSLAGKISDDEMRRLNYAVDGERRDVREVVAEFRRSKGL